MHLGDPALPRAVPHEMHDHRERGRQLAVQSHPVETGRSAQRLQSGGDMLGGIGVDGAAPTFVPSVQCGQQLGDFSAPHLSDHQPVGPHAQCLSHQISQSHPARSLLIGGTGLQADHMRMIRPQFGGVLGEHDPLVHTDRAQQAGEERRLPETLAETPLVMDTRKMKSTRVRHTGPSRAVIYVRISQDRTGAHLGVDRQREDCEALAESRGWEVVEVYVDNDLSAYSGKPRKDYRRMLADLELGTATVVIAWHTDRLHRSPTELEEYIDLSQRRGVDTHTCQAGELDLSTSSGRMTARIHGAVARHESEHKAERVARARLQKAKAGKFGGGLRPFGWGMPTGETRKKAVKGTDEEIDVPVLDMTKLVPAEAAALEAGTDMILAAGSVKGWARWLADKGLLSTTGKPITHNAARDLLLRPRNAGIAIYQGEEIGRGLWEVAVPEPKFRAVVAILTDPNRVTTTGSEVKWLGSLIYKCGRPGCKTTVRNTKVGGSGAPSYRCQDNHGGGRHAATLDAYIQDLLVERLSKPDAVDLLGPAPDGISVGKLQVESETIRRRLTDLAAMFGSGQISMAQFTEGSDVARAQLEGVTAQLARAATKDPLVGLVGVKDVRAAWEACELGRQRKVLQALLEVTLRPPRQGRMPDGGYFDYDAVETRWKR